MGCKKKKKKRKKVVSLLRFFVLALLWACYMVPGINVPGTLALLLGVLYGTRYICTWYLFFEADYRGLNTTIDIIEQM